jgi:CBS domain-containing protein
MSTTTVVVLLVVGVLLLIGSVLARVWSSGKYEIKTIDLVFIVVPLLVVGIATGRLQGLDLFGVKLDLAQLFEQAANRKIEDQVGTAPVTSVEDVVEPIVPGAKGGVSEIPRFIERRTEAISFRLGAGIYVAQAIEQYFTKLYGSSYLRFIVIENPDGTLFGTYPAADLIAYLRLLPDGYYAITDMLNRGDAAALQVLLGFIPASAAVTVATTKRDALEAMERFDRSALPVVDATNRFVGTVERSKLITSLLLAVTTPRTQE